MCMHVLGDGREGREVSHVQAFALHLENNGSIEECRTGG